MIFLKSVLIELILFLKSSMGFNKCILSCMHNYSIIKFHHLKKKKFPCFTPIQYSHFPLANTYLFLITTIGLSFTYSHIIGIRQHIVFSYWYLSLNKMHLRLIHVFYWLNNSSFLFISKQYSTVWMHHILSSNYLMMDILATIFGNWE